MSEYIVAIDLGSSKIAGMVAQKDSKGLLKILAVESETSEGIRRGLVTNPSEAAHCVGRLVKKLQNIVKIEIGQVYVGRGGHTLKSIVNKVSDFFDDDKELSEEIIKILDDKNDSLEFENAKVYENFEQEFMLDGQPQANPIGCTCSHIEARYLLVLGKKELDDRICSCLERIPQELAGLFTSPIVMSDSLITPHDKELGCVVIDFGAETTSVVVYANNFIRHIAVVPFGGKTITQDIKDLQVTTTDAENLKKKFGCALVALEDQPKTITLQSPLHGDGEHKVHTRNLAAIIEARMDEIMEMVCMEIDKSGYAKQLRAGVIISGGASQLRGLPELIGIKTGMKVRLGSFEHLLSDTDDIQQISPSHALLMGLLNFGNKDCQLVEPEADKDLNPVPPPQKRKKGKIRDIIEKTLFTDREEQEYN